MILNFDESGNLGKQGRYFTIACIGGDNLKPLKNIMNKAIVKVKEEFPQYSDHKELKASGVNPVIKEYILRKISTKNISIKYITADLMHIKKDLLSDENLLYNYLLNFLVIPVAKKVQSGKLTLLLDKRTIKVKSTNSFSDYIKTKVRYELGIIIDIEVQYLESHNSVSIQAADFVANAIYTKYEYNNPYYYDIIKGKIDYSGKFPRQSFGVDKVV